MVTKTTRPKASATQSEARGKSTKVLVCASDFTAEATIRQPSDRSLLDILNNGLTVSAKKEGADFITLSGVRVFLPDGQDQVKKSSRVKKADIFFVAEAGGEQPHITPKVRSRSRASTHSDTVMAKVLMSSHRLVGKMDARICRQWPEAPNDKERFLSLADVELASRLSNGEWQFRSVAVNKDHVVSVTEHTVEPPAVEMTLVNITRATENIDTVSAADLPENEFPMPDFEPRTEYL